MHKGILGAPVCTKKLNITHAQRDTLNAMHIYTRFHCTLMQGNSLPGSLMWLLPLAFAYLFTYACAELLTRAHWCDISQDSSCKGDLEPVALTSSSELWASVG